MNENIEIDELVETGLEFKNQGMFQDSIDILENVLSKFPNYSNKDGIKIVLAGNYYEIQDYKKAINYAYEVISIKPESELPHLILYLSYYELEEHEKAFMVLFTFLQKYPAKLFKDTLEELLEGLSEGYGMSHKDDIILYSRKNGISIPDDLIDDDTD